MTMTVSVLIPNYNHAPYLLERIESVLQQTFQNFEVILLDDSSTDNSRDIIRSYANHPRVTHVVLNDQNTGNPFVQWQRGIRLAQGDYIWIAESDDVAEPQFLEILVGELERHPQAVVAYSHSLMIDSDGQPMNFSWHRKGSHGEVNVFDGKDYIRRKMLVDCRIYNASMVVFRRDVFTLLPDTYQQYRYCGDWLFWTLVCQHGQVVEVCQTLNRFRQHPNKVSVQSQVTGRNWADNAGVMREIMDIAGLNGWERRCVKGRCTKQFNRSNGHTLQEVRRAFPDIYGGRLTDIVCYEVGKLFGFLKK